MSEMAGGAPADDRQAVKVWSAEQGRPCLLAFGGLAGELDIPAFEFFGLTEGWEVSRVFVRDLAQAWYHRGAPELGPSLAHVEAGLASILDELRPPRLVCVGNSAGGFAALYFGYRLGCDEVLAFSPQVAIGRLRRHLWNDHRWGAQIAALRQDPPEHRVYDVAKVYPRRSGVEPEPPRVHLYFGSAHKLDRAHASHFARGRTYAELHPVPGDGHNIVRQLRDAGDLAPMLRAALEPSSSDHD